MVRPVGSILLLALVLSLLWPASAARGEDVPRLDPSGVPTALRLDAETPTRAFEVRVEAGTRALHVVASAPYDVDLFVHPSALESDTVEGARYVANSLETVETLVIEPDDGETFAEDEVFHVYVVHPSAAGLALDASVAAWLERDAAEPVLQPSVRTRLEIPPGVASVRRRLLLPGGLAFAAVEAETPRGRARLVAVHDGVKVPGLPRGNGTLVFLRGQPAVPPGAWAVDVERPAGVAADVGVPVALQLCLAPVTADAEPGAEDLPVRLRGADGSTTVRIEEDGYLDFVIDVTPAMQTVEILSSYRNGDVDLYATRGRPVRTEGGGNWEYALWRDGGGERLYLGGDAPLPVGRYWVLVRHVEGEPGDVLLRWQSHDAPVPREDRDHVLTAMGKGAVGEGVVWDAVLAANEPLGWWDLLPPIGPGSHVQVLGADKDVDLFVGRADTGAVLWRSVSALNDEHLQIPADAIVPEGAGLRLAVGRWDVGRPAVLGEVHVGARERPLPPPAYFPPYAAFGTNARGRTLASAVEVDTDDGSGSGVVVSPTGLILTCEHVIDEVGEGGEIRIAFPTSARGRPRRLFRARVVDSVPDDDLALLELLGDFFGRPLPEKRPLPFVPIGDSRSLAIETPLRVVGYGAAGSSRFAPNLTVMHGVLCGVELEGDEERWLITDARLGPGNSGGGYYDERGELVGLHSSGIGEAASSLGYGRPVSLLPRAWRERILAEGGVVPLPPAPPRSPGSGDADGDGPEDPGEEAAPGAGEPSPQREMSDWEAAEKDALLYVTCRMYSPVTDPILLWMQEKTVAIPLMLLVLVLLGRRRPKRALRATLAALLAVGVGMLISGLLWAVVDRPRPPAVFAHHLVTPDEIAACAAHPDALPLRKDPARSASFPSRHAMTAGIFATVLCLASWPLGMVAWTYALLVALGRVYAAKHWPSDVVAGLILGFVLGWLAWRLVPRLLARLGRSSWVAEAAPDGTAEPA